MMTPKDIVRHFRSVAGSVGVAIRNDPEVQRLFRTHPRTTRFIFNRFSVGQPLGLRFTFGLLVAVVFLWLFFELASALAAQSALAQADLRVLSVLQLLRSPAFTSVMLFITYLGNWQITSVGVVLFGAYLALTRRWLWLAALLLSVLGGEAFVWSVKTLIGRPRPELANALVPAQGASFPSGHAFIAFSFYGLLAWFLVKQVSTCGRKIAIVLIAIIGMLVLGFSRIYLGVHWPTDVLASLAAGPAWLALVITALSITTAEIYPARPDGAAPRLRRTEGGLLALVWLGVVIVFYVTHPALTLVAPTAPQRVLIQSAELPQALFTKAPRFTEDIVGRTLEPINVILIGTESDVTRAFREAGWLPADPIGVGSFWRLITAELFNRPDPRAPGLPVFWEGKPNPFTFEQPTASNSARERHHLHLWDTPYLVGQRPIWTGTVHLDKQGNIAPGVPIPIHAIDPAIDTERESLRAALVATSCVDDIRETKIVEPMLGKNAIGSSFFTDGNSLIISLNCK